MGHPHNEHRQHRVEKSRVAKITRGYKHGGGVHADAKEDRKLIKKMIAERVPEGKKAKRRADRVMRAKGGKVGHHKKGSTHVNVIVNGKGDGAPPMPPAAMMAPPPGPPMGPPPGPPPGAVAGLGGPPPGAGGPPPGSPPMLPPRARGGGVKSGSAWEEGKRLGTHVQHSDGKGTTNTKANLDRGRPVTFKTGGGVTKSFYARGGKVEADGKPGKQMGPKLPGGVVAAETRLAQAGRAKRGYKGPMKETDGAT